MGEPKYDEDTVNLGYLKKVLSETSDEIEVKYKEVSRHYGTKPTPPYYKGDTWIDGDVVYTCINSRQIGLYEDSDWTTESGAKKEAEEKSKVFLTKPYNYRPGDMWILQSDSDHKAGKKGEMLISTAGRKEYDEDDWINMLGYGNIISINEVVNNLNEAIKQIGNVEEATEDGIIVTFYRNTSPEVKYLGDLWYVTDSIGDYLKGNLYRYDGTDWKLIEDEKITEAFKEANEDRIVSDGKIQSFYSDTEPSINVGVGDLWIDTSDDDRLYRYNGTKWVAVYDTRIHNLIVNTNTTSERVAEIQTDLGSITSKVSTIEEQVTTTTGDIERIDKTITENTAKQEIKDNEILQTVTNQVSIAKQEAIDSANSSTDEKLQDYSTTSQVESKISQKANEITSTVSNSYATKGELSTAKSEIKQTTDSISLEVNKKVNNSNYTPAQILLMINDDESEVKIKGDKIDINGKAVKFKTNISSSTHFTEADRDRVWNGYLNDDLTEQEKELYDINNDGQADTFDAQEIADAIINNNGYININGTLEIDPYSGRRTIVLRDGEGKIKTSIGFRGIQTESLGSRYINAYSLNARSDNGNVTATMAANNDGSFVYADSVMGDEIRLGNGFKLPEILHGNVIVTPSAANTPTRKSSNIREDI